MLIFSEVYSYKIGSKFFLENWDIERRTEKNMIARVAKDSIFSLSRKSCFFKNRDLAIGAYWEDIN